MSAYNNLNNTGQIYSKEIKIIVHLFTIVLMNSYHLSTVRFFHPHFQDHLLGLVNKKTDNAHFLKLAASELISKYSYLTHIYTDGSKIGDIVSAAFTIPSLDI